ncbi:PEGA domain-containing protein [bacterium]|nr:PEGA domain-containing protein [candidate division CSSED10-310 bacterium]
MNRLDVDWSEPTFWEKFRLPFFILIVLIIMSSLGAVFLGADGILRMLGLRDDSIRSQLVVSIEPQDASVKLDMVVLEKPIQIPVTWTRGSEHILDAQHPAYLPEKLLIRIPADPQKPPEIVGRSDQADIVFSPEKIEARFSLTPEFVKIKIKSKPSGAVIEIDGVSTNKTTPMEYELKTGETVKIKAVKDGYETATFELNVPGKGLSDPVILNLNKLPKEESSQKNSKKTSSTKEEKKGKLDIRSSYPVDVYVGSKRVIQDKKSASVQVSSGKQIVRIVNPDYLLNLEQSTTIKPGKTESIILDPPGKMALSSDPPGAMVSVANHEIGRTPGTYEVAPGLYKVEFRWSQCSDAQSIWVKVVSGQTRRIPVVKGCSR